METTKSLKVIQAGVLILVINTTCLAQKNTYGERFWTLGFNMGSCGVSSYNQNSLSGTGFKKSEGFVSEKNGRGGITLTGTKSLGIQTGFCWENKHNRNFTSIQFDLQQNRSSYVFDLPFQKKVATRSGDNDADDPLTGDSDLVTTGKWAESDLYLKCSASIQEMWFIRNKSYFLKGDQYAYLKLSFGQTFFHRNQGSVIQTGQADYGKDEFGNITTATTTAACPKSYMVGAEIGLRSFSIDKDRSVDIGFAWRMPFESSYTRDYEFQEKQPYKQGQPTTFQTKGKENITFNGNSFYLNVTYSFNSKLPQKPVTNQKKFERLNEAETKDLAVESVPKVEMVHIHKPHSLNGRRVKINEKVDVGDSIIVAHVWDKGTVDGDKISLYLNGQMILDNYTVAKAKKEIILHLVQGKNYLVMHALNLGRIPPNTAAIDIKGDVKTKQVVLNSDLKRSGALELDYISK